MSEPAKAEVIKEEVTTLPTQRNVADVLRLCGAKTKTRFAPLCKAQGIAYPPQRIRFLAFKEEKKLEVWGANSTGKYAFLAEYPIHAASGTSGPKRREGDCQVPEGRYRLTTLNPMSRFHVSLRVDYPNTEDIAANPGVPRNQLGSDIYIHGGAVSIGCLAMGDAAIEELFCLAAQTDVRHRDILIVPHDLRQWPAPGTDDANLGKRYTYLAKMLDSLKR